MGYKRHHALIVTGPDVMNEATGEPFPGSIRDVYALAVRLFGAGTYRPDADEEWVSPRW